MDTLDTKNEQNEQQLFVCENCDYKCIKKSNFNRHLATDKHLWIHNGYKMDTKNEQNEQNEQLCGNKFVCSCGKQYKYSQGLSKHKNNCKMNVNDTNNNTDLVKYLMKENTELKNMILDVCKNSKPSEQNQINCNNTINSHNKSFNLNVFLNETCKDAMNIMEFVDSLKIQLSDLENVGKLGYVQGISKIIVNNLNSLDETKRPVHCTDSKREVLYVKDEDKWEKENEDNSKMRKVIKHVTHKNSKLIKEFKQKHPGCEKSDSRFSNQYDKLIIEAMGGKGDNDAEKEDKIIKNIAKNVVIDKTNI